MHNSDFRDAVNFHLCLPVVGAAPPPEGAAGGVGLHGTFNLQRRVCPGCHRQMAANGLHAFCRISCPHALPASSTHAILTSACRSVLASTGSNRARPVGRGLEGGPLNQLANWALKPGAAPAGAALPANGQRADLLVSLSAPGDVDQAIIAIDVTTTAAVAISGAPNLAGFSAPIPSTFRLKTGSAATRAAEAKIKFYSDRWDFPANSFYPLALEVHGAASKHTHALIERVARAVFPGVGGEGGLFDFGGKRAAFVSYFRQRISVALQSANARALRRWRRLCWSPGAVVVANPAPA